MTTATAHRDTAAVGSSLWAKAGVLAFGSVLVGLDTSLVNVGLDSIAGSLHSSLSLAQWATSAYLLALAAALPVCVWLGGRVGTGRLWLWSLVGFTAASVLCAAAWSMPTLIAARVAQGLAGGLLIPAGMTILGQLAGRERMGRVVAVSSVPAILAPAVGPVIGAFLIADLSWRWLFLVNVPIGAVGLLLARVRVPRGDPDPAVRLDMRGLALIAPGLPLVVFGVARAAEARTLLTVGVWLPLVSGVAATAAFVRHSVRARNPLLDVRLWRDRVFAPASAEVFLAGACLFGGLIVMPLYFQVALGRSIVGSGLLLMAFSLGAAIAFPVAGWANDRFGGGIFAVCGLVVTLGASAPMALLGDDPSVVAVESLQVARGIGLALAGSPGVSSALASVRRDRMPDASVQVNILSRVGGALGGAVFTVVLAGALTGRAGPGVQDAFDRTFWLLTATAGLALIAAVWLATTQRRGKQAA